MIYLRKNSLLKSYFLLNKLFKCCWVKNLVLKIFGTSILNLSSSSVNKHPLTILGAKVPYYPKDLTNIKMTAHCYYLWKMSDRTYFKDYWYWRNNWYLKHNYCWSFDSSEYTQTFLLKARCYYISMEILKLSWHIEESWCTPWQINKHKWL